MREMGREGEKKGGRKEKEKRKTRGRSRNKKEKRHPVYNGEHSDPAYKGSTVILPIRGTL